MSRINQIQALNRRLLRARFIPEPLLVAMGGLTGPVNRS